MRGVNLDRRNTENDNVEQVRKIKVIAGCIQFIPMLLTETKARGFSGGAFRCPGARQISQVPHDVCDSDSECS
jgi:hypothetical protein